MGGRCSSARSLAGRRFSYGLVGRGRASEGTRRIFGGRRHALADSLPRGRLSTRGFVGRGQAFVGSRSRRIFDWTAARPAGLFAGGDSVCRPLSFFSI